MAVMEKLMTTQEAIKYLRISRVTLYALMKNRKFPAHRVGRQYRYRKIELDKWLDNQ